MRSSTCLVALLTILLLTGCTESQFDYPSREMPQGLTSDAAQLRAANDLFMNKCVSCHGKTSEGRSDRAAFFEPPAPDFTDAHFTTFDPAYLYWRIATGKNEEPFRSQGSVMPAWGQHFSERQIWQLVAYIMSRSH